MAAALRRLLKPEELIRFEIPLVLGFAGSVLTVPWIPAHQRSVSFAVPRTFALRCLTSIVVLAMPRAETRAESEPAIDHDPAPVAASVEGIAAAALPGLVVHGTGLWVRGDRAGARNLLKLEGLALSMAIVSGGVIGVSGASRRLTSQTIPVLVSSAGLFLQSWLADIYGTAGGGRRKAAPSLTTSPLSLEVGGFYVRDLLFDYGPFSRAKLSWNGGRFGFSTEAAVSLGGNNQRLIANGRYRFWGQGSRRPSEDGSRLELASSGRFNRHGREQFSSVGGEVALSGRFDGARLGDSLKGSFGDLRVGFGLEATRYATGERATDLSDAILVRYGFGMYLGGPGRAARGEVSVYYDHRRDEYAGGISPGDQAGGFLGYFGVGLDLDIGDRYGIVTNLEVGSAFVFGVSLKARIGEAR